MITCNKLQFESCPRVSGTTRPQLLPTVWWKTNNCCTKEHGPRTEKTLPNKATELECRVCSLRAHRNGFVLARRAEERRRSGGRSDCFVVLLRLWVVGWRVYREDDDDKIQHGNQLISLSFHLEGSVVVEWECRCWLTDYTHKIRYLIQAIVCISSDVRQRENDLVVTTISQIVVARAKFELCRLRLKASSSSISPMAWEQVFEIDTTVSLRVRDK